MQRSASTFSPFIALRSRCPDGSDQDFCLHKIYTGCFAKTHVGLKIASCKTCVCQLRDSSSVEFEKALIFRSVSPNHRGSHVSGAVCLQADSHLLCDGHEDCVGGKDEDPALCFPAQAEDAGQKENDSSLKRRTPKALEGDVDEKDKSFLESANFLLVLIAAALISVYFLGCIVVAFFVNVKRKKIRVKENDDEGDANSQSTAIVQVWAGDAATDVLPAPSFADSASDVSHLTTCSLSTSHSGPPVNDRWTWNRARLVRELGRGASGTVYLAREEATARPIAVKVKTCRSDHSKASFRRELDALQRLAQCGGHRNVVGLIAYNQPQEILVVSFCGRSSLRSFLTVNRASFLDQVNAQTGELDVEALASKIGVHHHPLPVSGYVGTLTKKVNGDEEEKVITTRKLIEWSAQVSQYRTGPY